MAAFVALGGNQALGDFRRRCCDHVCLELVLHCLSSVQTVSFVEGKPVFSKYMDSFPFPFYVIVRDTVALPRVLADLLRQWFSLNNV